MPVTISQKLRLEGVERQEVALLIRYDERMTKYYCIFCQDRSPLFATQGRVFGIIYGHHVDPSGLTVPCGFPCHNCGAVFFVNALTQ